jgi:hypothetical protein
MAQQLKRWESPRHQGRNAKGRGGSARQRQLKKRLQNLRQKLKDTQNQGNQGGVNHSLFYVFYGVLSPNKYTIAASRGEG